MGICHICKENDTGSQIKAGCGHLIFICNDCRGDQMHVQHSDCIVCKGGETPDMYAALEIGGGVFEYMCNMDDDCMDYDPYDMVAECEYVDDYDLREDDL